MTGHEIGGLREHLGWSQARLAKALGVHRSTVLRWERGAHQPRPQWMERLQGLAAQAGEGLTLAPLPLHAASAFIARNHRHHPPPQGAKWALGATLGGHLVGVATIGRPVSRRLDDGFTAEVTRVATDGSRNACSFLLGAAWRVSKAAGYRRLLTYTLTAEPGASLRAAGWRPMHQTRGRSWSVPSRPRSDQHPLGRKIRWEVSIGSLCKVIAHWSSLSTSIKSAS